MRNKRRNPHTIRERPPIAVSAAVLAAIAASIVASVGHAAFPGTNGQIVFVKGSDGFGDALFLVNSDGTGRRKLTLRGSHAAGYSRARWSPDGRRLAFSALLSPTYEGNFAVRRDGTGLQGLPAHEGVEWNSDPAWSPDGARIVFSSEAGDLGAQLYIASLRTDSVRILGNDHSNSNVISDTEPVWSPDGRWICFQRSVNDSKPHLYLIRPDGTGLRKLAIMTGEHADWSPDAAKIVFDDERDVFTITPAGKQLDRLQQAATYPAWSPDAVYIAFQRKARGRTLPDVWIMRADGSLQVRVARTAGAPDWQPHP